MFAIVPALLSLTLTAPEPARAVLAPSTAKQVSEAVDRAIMFLRGAQNTDGSFGDGDFRAPVTGLVLTGILRAGHVTAADPMVARGLAYLESQIQPDGAIAAAGGNRNYGTAVAVMAFAAAKDKPKYKAILDKAVAYLKTEQWDEGEGITPTNAKYGGAGYGRKSRPDLSNTSFLLEALDSAGLPKDDPAYKRAIVFIRRCQNLAGEGANDLPAGAAINDGGFYYTAAEDYNPGGGTVAQGLRSYGSMTYAGLKSFLYAGVDKNDFRVKAAHDWVKKHYSVEENPGMGDQGLYYYYHTFAKALSILGEDKLIDAAGTSHDWRVDLVKALLAKQAKDGSWSNPNKRWLENDPRLVTAYGLLALSAASK